MQSAYSPKNGNGKMIAVPDQAIRGHVLVQIASYQPMPASSEGEMKTASYDFDGTSREFNARWNDVSSLLLTTP